MSTLTLAKANKIIRTAFAKAEELDLKPLPSVFTMRVVP